MPHRPQTNKELFEEAYKSAHVAADVSERLRKSFLQAGESDIMDVSDEDIGWLSEVSRSLHVAATELKSRRAGNKSHPLTS